MHSLVVTADRKAGLLRNTGLVLLGTGILTASSYVAVPMYPVPMTMQTLAVTLIGAGCGARLGMLTVAFWLMEAAMGLPVLAGGAGGIAAFAGPTAGYLLVFPFAAALSGLIAGKSRHVLRLFAAMVAGNALCLIGGGAWLAVLSGAQNAWIVGVLPFILGGLVKSGIGASALRLAR